MKSKNLKNKKGITLVALIVTIIILLILAGVSIASLTKSGLFEKARQAEQKSENAQIKEETTLGEYENKIGEYIEGTRDTGTFFQSDNGNMKIPDTNENTLKSFTNLEPGLYFVSYTQMMTNGYTGVAIIKLNDTLIASNYGVANNFGSPTACPSGIVNITSKEDVIKLDYICHEASSSDDRAYAWQIIKLK